MRLTTTQIDECLAPSVKYDEAAYAAVYNAVKLSAKQQVVGEGHLEANFPGVKPQHVAHMLKQLRGDDELVTITIHAAHGVTLIRRATPVVKPAKAKKPAKAAVVATDEPKTI